MLRQRRESMSRKVLLAFVSTLLLFASLLHVCECHEKAAAITSHASEHSLARSHSCCESTVESSKPIFQQHDSCCCHTHIFAAQGLTGSRVAIHSHCWLAQTAPEHIITWSNRGSPSLTTHYDRGPPGLRCRFDPPLYLLNRALLI